jgi:hypothetical protein
MPLLVLNARLYGEIALQNDTLSYSLINSNPAYDPKDQKKARNFIKSRIDKVKKLLAKSNLTPNDIHELAIAKYEAVRDAATVKNIVVSRKLLEQEKGKLGSTALNKGKRQINIAYQRLFQSAKLDARRTIVDLYSNIAKLLKIKDPSFDRFIKPKSIKYTFKNKSIKLSKSRDSTRDMDLELGNLGKVAKEDRPYLLSMVKLAKTAWASLLPELKKSPMLADLKKLGMGDPIKELSGMVSRYEKIAKSKSDKDYPLLYLAAQNLQTAMLHLITLHEVKLALSGPKGKENFRKICPDDVTKKDIDNLSKSYALALPLMRVLANPDVSLMKIPTVAYDTLSESFHSILPKSAVDVENASAEQIESFTKPGMAPIPGFTTADFNRSLLLVFKYLRNTDTRSAYERTSAATGWAAAERLRPVSVSMNVNPKRAPYLNISDTASLNLVNTNAGHLYHFIEDNKFNWGKLNDMKKALGLKSLDIPFSLVLKSAMDMLNGSDRVPGYSKIASQWSTSSKRVSFSSFFSSLSLGYGPVKLGNQGLKSALTKATNSSKIRAVVDLLTTKSADQIRDKDWALVKRAYEGGHQPTIMAMDAMVASAKAVFELERNYGNNLSKDLTNGKSAFAGPVRAFQLLDLADTLKQELPGIARRWVPPVKTNEVRMLVAMSDQIYDPGQDIKATVTLRSRTKDSLRKTLPGENFETAIFDRIESDPFTGKRIWYALGNDKRRGVGTVAYLGDEETRWVYNKTQRKSEKRTFGNVYVFLKKVRGRLTVLEAENYRTISEQDLEDAGITKLKLARYEVSIVGRNRRGQPILGPVIYRNEIPKKWKFLEDTFWFKWSGDDLLKKKQSWMRDLDFSKKEVQFPILPASPASKNRRVRGVTIFRSL